MKIDPNNAITESATAVLKYSRKPQYAACKMATVDVHSSAFRRFNRSSCASNSSNSFSMRNILNISDTEAEKCAGCQSHDILPSHWVPFPCLACNFPFIPRVVWPTVHYNNNDSAPYTTALRNQQELTFTPQYNVWGCSSADKEIPLEAGVNLVQTKRRRPAVRKKKRRPLFSPNQIQTMEKEFAKQRYITEEKRAQLASEVNLTETQVKTWFQNRRTKWKKEMKGVPLKDGLE